MFTIGLHHFLIVSLLLAAAGIATMLTKRNAIGILIGVELLLNAAAINFVAFNRYSHGDKPEPAPIVAVIEKSESMAAKAPETQPAQLPDVKVNTEVASVPVPATRTDLVGSSAGWPKEKSAAAPARVPAHDGRMFAIFIIVLAAAEAAIGLAIVLNYYNNFSSVDVEKAHALKG